MTKLEFIKLMNFPAPWIELEMYPDVLFKEQRSGYQPGHEDGSEHDRNGAFHWWLKQNPTKDQLKKLVTLSYLDPDQMMASDVRKYISLSPACDSEILAMITPT